jgi:serine/threonine protein kinase
MILFNFAGPYIGVAGAVFLGRPVCEPLTPVMPLFYLPHHENIILGTAYVVKALKIALDNLEKFYNNLYQHDQIIQTYFPYFNKVKIGETTANLTYVKKVENHYVFQAIMECNDGSSPQHVIIKFAKRYSEACHKECQALEIAPELFFCEQIAGGWYVVIMEQLMEHNSLFYLAQDQDKKFMLNKVIESIKKIHDLGFVHGDMRLPNILIGPGDSIKIIDFDWAGKIGEVVYPPLLNQEIDVWHSDVKAGKKILPEHDLYILNTELKKIQ